MHSHTAVRMLVAVVLLVDHMAVGWEVLGVAAAHLVHAVRAVGADVLIGENVARVLGL
jgi:hypothetical protein